MLEIEVDGLLQRRVIELGMRKAGEGMALLNMAITPGHQPIYKVVTVIDHVMIERFSSPDIYDAIEKFSDWSETIERIQRKKTDWEEVVADIKEREASK